MTSGQILTKISKEKNITQKELAECSGVNQSSIARMMKDEFPVNLKVLRALRVKYKININQFFD